MARTARPRGHLAGGCKRPPLEPYALAVSWVRDASLTGYLRGEQSPFEGTSGLHARRILRVKRPLSP